MSPRRYLRPVELARRTGVSTATLRHYETIGVLPKASRSANGYRAFPEKAVDRVRLVRRALDFGFSLRELAEMLAARDRGERPCRRVRELAESKLGAVARRIEQLERLKREMEALLEDWDLRLERARGSEPAHLLEAFLEEEKDDDDRKVFRHPHTDARARALSGSRSPHPSSGSLRRTRGS